MRNYFLLACKLFHGWGGMPPVDRSEAECHGCRTRFRAGPECDGAKTDRT